MTDITETRKDFVLEIRISDELDEFIVEIRQGLGAYSIEIERMMDNHGFKNTDQVWTGTFTDGQHNLKVMGCLEAC